MLELCQANVSVTPGIILSNGPGPILSELAALRFCTLQAAMKHINRSCVMLHIGFALEYKDRMIK